MDGFGAIALISQRNNVVQGSSLSAEKGQSVSSNEQSFLTLMSNMLNGQVYKEGLSANTEMSSVSEEDSLLNLESILTELSKLLESLEQPMEEQLDEISKLLEQLLGLFSEEVSVMTESSDEGML